MSARQDYLAIYREYAKAALSWCNSQIQLVLTKLNDVKYSSHYITKGALKYRFCEFSYNYKDTLFSIFYEFIKRILKGGFDKKENNKRFAYLREMLTFH